ncbi:hypothetical protein [Roseateles saccharophilus]|uniref:Uncharacterized protein n=1 Tax=Roseateles saccharophilus TaxID=304 RepID=A0A4R3V780_ROSSA|nr:hypothetical protein [Roseateles saccharophilus]MDG0831669.1 hypothetical protein [Roseateles saccharophilus]TCV00916.1 hypothetical protein EV671_100745 [Roseateles saccharophilus]
MSSVVRLTVPTELLPFVRLAQLLQALDGQGAAADAHQYRLLVQKIGAELQAHQGHEALTLLLDHFPASAEIYENLQYAHAGLCRAPLEASLSSELAARDLLSRVRKA